MIEKTGNLWDEDADARVITTNGYVRNDGACVMGRGVAQQCARKFPMIPYLLGSLIKERGNNVYLVGLPEETYTFLVSFPVKHYFWQEADFALIERSAKQLRELSDTYPWKKIVLPRPGTGNGRLEWEDVKPIIEPYLDDRFTVVSLPSAPP